MTHSSQIVLLALVAGLAVPSAAQAQTYDSFAVLGGSTVTNTGISTISGNIGLAPGTAAPGTGDSGANHIVLTNGVLHINDAVAIQAQSDLTIAFNTLMGLPSPADNNLSGDVLGNLGTISTLTAGVYVFDSSAQLTGQLTLNGDSDDIFVFQIDSTLTTAPGSSIILGGTVQAGNVFWVVGSSATLDTSTAFQGQILALTSITLNTAATISCGAAWARNGAVTLDTNTIGLCTFVAPPGDVGGNIDEETATANELAARDALNAFVDSGGTLPLSIEVIALLTPEEVAAAFEELSGEIGTRPTPVAIQATNSYLDEIFDRLAGNPGTVVFLREGAPPNNDSNDIDDNTVSVMGYAADPAAASLDAFASIASDPIPNVSQWTVWGGTYGNVSRTRGDSTTGAHASSTEDYGVAIGFDRHVAADTLFGFSLAAGGTNFDLDDSLGSGHSAMLEAALYARQSIEQAYVSGVLSYGWHQSVTKRTVNLGGANQYRADFATQVVAGGIEAGYELGWFTPYVALRGQLHSTPGYSETALAGSNVYALSYDGRLTLAARTEIGARFDWTTDIEGGSVSLTSSIAWAHDLTGANTATAWYSALGTASRFTVTGATPASDSILLSAGLGADFDNGVSLNTALNASLAANSHSYGASVQLEYSW